MDLWQRLVKLLAGYRCEYCGCPENVAPLAAHHIFTKSIQATRYDENNGCCLDNGHHNFYAHKKPHEFRDFITEKRGQAWWDKLRMRSNQRGKIDLKATAIYLAKKIEEFEAGQK